MQRPWGVAVGTQSVGQIFCSVSVDFDSCDSSACGLEAPDQVDPGQGRPSDSQCLATDFWCMDAFRAYCGAGDQCGIFLQPVP